VAKRNIVSIFQSYRDISLGNFYRRISSTAGKEAAFGPNDADKSVNGHEESDDSRAVEDIDEVQAHALAQPQALAERLYPR
jgi:hypothetical protein